MQVVSRITVVCTLFFLVAASQPVFSQGLRGFESIGTPKADSRPQKIKLRRVKGKRLKQEIPLPKSLVEKVLRQLLGQWNRPGMPPTLSRRFPNRNRLLDSLDVSMNRDASLRITGIQSFQTLDQHLQKDRKVEGGRAIMSRVLVTAQTQVEFNDPQKGLQRIDGTNEYLISIRHLPPADGTAGN